MLDVLLITTEFRIVGDRVSIAQFDPQKLLISYSTSKFGHSRDSFILCGSERLSTLKNPSASIGDPVCYDYFTEVLS